MSRAAFAPLIKFTSHTDSLIALVDELDIVEADLFDDTQDQKVLKRIKYLEENRKDEFAKVEQQWVNANKMRTWIIEKKKNLREKVEKEERPKFMEKKKASEIKEGDTKPETKEGAKDQ
jgi:hypothetical protein